MTSRLRAHQRIQRLLGHVTAPGAPQALHHQRVVAETVQDIVAKADALDDNNSPKECLRLLQCALPKQRGTEDKLQIMWRLVRCHKRLLDKAKKSGNAKKSAHHIVEGLHISDEALTHREAATSGEVHKYMAVMLAEQADAGGARVKAKLAATIVKHTKVAATLLPKDPSLQFMLGRLKFAFAGASWLEKKALSLVGYPLPPATFSEAFSHFRQSENLHPSMLHKLWLAKSLLKKYPIKSAAAARARKRAAELLRIVRHTQSRTAEDELALKDAVALSRTL